MPLYQRTQVESRYFIILFSSAFLYLLALLFIILPIEQDGIREVGIAGIAVVLALEVLVFTTVSMMTVTVTKTMVSVRMMMGMVQANIALSEIIDCQIAHTQKTISWGKPTPPNVRIYCINAGDGVTLMLSDGGNIYIGSSEPDELLLAIRAAMSS